MDNYDDEVGGYQYQLWSSTTNIFFENNDGIPYSLYWHPFHNPSFRLPPLDTMTTICSSSQGLIACRDPFSNYYIGNPLSEGRNAYISLPPPPRFHPRDYTSVVLATDIFENGAPLAFHLICAVRVMASTYIFDTYSSLIDDWLSSELQVLRGDIFSHTGVSYGRMACWVCEQRGVGGEVVEFDPVSKLIRSLGLPYPYRIFAQSKTELQLGRIGNRLGLVAVRERPNRGVELHVHGENGWERYAFLGIDISPDRGTMNWVDENIAREFLDRVTNFQQTAGGLRQRRMILREMPRPLRFESFKMEVLLSVDGWVIVWENNSINGSMKTRTVPCPVAGGMPARFPEAIPHVSTSWLPGDFFFNHQASPDSSIQILE